ncbi:hypothetical protein V1477_002280 [Vespula maculifrons]|uniref:Uncharacterized protein n=1 Tax=Vespula maculifrons TaxID=7453 RepID=A0ABD2CW58_VESMC
MQENILNDATKYFAYNELEEFFESYPLVELLIFEFDMYPVLALLDNILVILPREDNSVGICASKRKMIQLIHIDLNCIFKCVRNNGGHFIDPIDFYLNRIFV